MTSKSLSTSTLSLKFMQNAHRAKQLKEVELDRAEIKDDGKWEISQALRESWGLSENTEPYSGDVHEASYLPFLFSEGDTINEPDKAATSSKPAGRRIFNRKGEEVSLVTPPSDPAGSNASAPQFTPSASTTGRKIHQRPVSISASGSSQQSRGVEQLKNIKDSKHSKSAREAIFESGGVGIDLRSQASRSKDADPASTFLKPVGVDDPLDIKAVSTTTRKSNSEQILHGARQKVKVKRERADESNETNESGKPKRKKKNLT